MAHFLTQASRFSALRIVERVLTSSFLACDRGEKPHIFHVKLRGRRTRLLLCFTGIQYCIYNVIATIPCQARIASVYPRFRCSILIMRKRTVQRPVDDPGALILEAWSQGLMTGSVVIMAAVTYANMRPGVLLHKLILLEVALPPSIGIYPLTWPLLDS